MPNTTVLLHVINLVVSVGVVTLLFALIYKLLPDVNVRWRDVWFGACATALLFTAGKFLIGLYLGKSTVASAFGAAGSVVIVLIWVYYSSLILFLGAEFTQVHAKWRGRPITTTEAAVPLTREARARQGIPTQEQREQVVARAEHEQRPGRAGKAREHVLTALLAMAALFLVARRVVERQQSLP
jgi:membrane protein